MWQSSLNAKQKETGVIAICFSDFHLRHTPPVWRSNEPSWYGAMERVCNQLNELHIKYQSPIIFTGDLFHHWKPPPELINFAIKNLPHLYAIPGNHDLPLHNYQDIKKSAFWTLVECMKITLIKPDETCVIPGVVLHGFPCGFKCQPYTGGSIDPFGLRIAVVHDYIWRKGFGYIGATEDSRVTKWENRIKGYDCAIFGDNHQGFFYKNIFNCGGLMRTKSDEINYKPMVGLLKTNGQIIKEYLDTSKDVYLDNKKLADVLEEKDGELNIREFLTELNSLDTNGDMNFQEALIRYMDFKRVDKGVRKVIIKVLEKDK